MHPTRLAAAALLASVLAAGPVLAPSAAAQTPLTEADFRSGTTGDLADVCGAAPGDPLYQAGIGWCHGFILAAGQYHATMSARRVAGHPLFCMPTESPSFDQVRTAFVGWARANPQFAGERAVDGLLRFAAATYPCPPQGAGAPRRR